MKSKLRDSVAVVTGASSGIGRATAREFARRGAHVVLAARRELPLKEVASECESFGVRARAVPADVAEEEQVERVARVAEENFGRIDVWVNNAAVSLFARFEEAPPEEFRRVIETNFFGYVYGARAALRRFREQGRGVLVNVSSVNGKVAAPYTSAYVSSKFAIVGLSESLRMELALDGDHDIRVSTVLPASIDTPIFQHAANHTGRAVKPLEPIYDASLVARAIVRCAERPRREVVVGRAGKGLNAARTLLPPAVSDRLVARQVDRDHFQDRREPPHPGSLGRPMPEWTGVSGDWGGEGETPRSYLALAGLAGVAGTALAARRLLQRRRSRGWFSRLLRP
jgi:short-subunit dehydrogenase